MTIFDRLEKGVLLPDLETTTKVAREIAHAIPENSVLGLCGDLGSGKTTLTAGIAASYGVETPVTSPTYTIYSIYSGSRQLIHMDAYRLAKEASMDSLGIEDLLSPPWLIVVEWPENVSEWLRDWDRILLEIVFSDDGKRILRTVEKSLP